MFKAKYLNESWLIYHYLLSKQAIENLLNRHIITYALSRNKQITTTASTLLNLFKIYDRKHYDNDKTLEGSPRTSFKPDGMMQSLP